MFFVIPVSTVRHSSGARTLPLHVHVHTVLHGKRAILIILINACKMVADIIQ